MSLAEKLIRDFEDLPEIQKREVIDFVEFLKIKNQRRLEKMMDEVIFENKEALDELAK
ncbi:DUF2281 domain-containing protein [Clostridium tunisiense]|uniref:DUF2281 domain-containing protein n=1 Tax=Clostridium tunisiense TaxID=219748 RepID=UPI000301AFC3|nr:DUF2281 domain-containing protein [Clostridium tunisiense]